MLIACRWLHLLSCCEAVTPGTLRRQASWTSTGHVAEICMLARDPGLAKGCQAPSEQSMA